MTLALQLYGLVLLAPSLLLAGGIPGRIALVGLDHQVYVADPDGGEPVPVTAGEPGRIAGSARIGGAVYPVASEAEETVRFQFSFPAWAPDGRSLLLMGTRLGEGGMAQGSGIYRVKAEPGGPVSPVFEDSRRGPVYVYWSPHGGRAALLVSQGEGISLLVVDSESGEAMTVAEGFPFYFDWRDDGQRILAHTGGMATDDHPAEVRLLDVRSGSAAKAPTEGRLLARWPVGFRAPAWSPDGRRLAYAARSEQGRPAALVVEDRDGGNRREVARVSSRLAFSWSPDGSGFALGEAGDPDGPLLAGVNFLGLEDGRREPLFAGPVAAFFWSPDGRRLLIVSPDFDSGQWRWLVVERQTRQAREVARFLPNPEFQSLLLHFDQYALSHRIWAPDSRHFVFAAYPVEARDQQGPADPVVWVVDVAGPSIRRVSTGRLAFWSPR
jgi:dipeptidyl aminopeptidase/acylaminoacyl peptidase